MPVKIPVCALERFAHLPGQELAIRIHDLEDYPSLDYAYESGDVLVSLEMSVDQQITEEFPDYGTVAKLSVELDEDQEGFVVHLKGLSRVRVHDVWQTEDGLILAAVEHVETVPLADDEMAEGQAYIRQIVEGLSELAERGVLEVEEVEFIATSVADPGEMADMVARRLPDIGTLRRSILAANRVLDRLKTVCDLVQMTIRHAQEEVRIDAKIQAQVQEMSKEKILRMKLEQIQSELGSSDDEAAELRRRIQESEMPEDIRNAAEREVGRLEKVSPQSGDAGTIRSHLEFMLELPWSTSSVERLDLEAARKILDRDHYGLEEVKERILEHLAVRMLKADDGSPKGGQLLFVGPPGVGKTSVGQSIGDALGRPVERIALGGSADQNDIRGHRRTYVGAVPGRILDAIRRAGVRNPVLILDEVDKLFRSSQGDPEAALLEVLDPAQNNGFVDRYLDEPFDLSDVLFILTANDLSSISAPLRDRLEVITFSGYTEEEKIRIARKHLIGDETTAAGLSTSQFRITGPALRAVVQRYTREAGVRDLTRKIRALARKAARRIAEDPDVTCKVRLGDLEDMLGSPKARPMSARKVSTIGVSTGLFYTPMGGDILFVEASLSPGKGKLVLTGTLGDVIRESAQAAWSYTKAHAKDLGIDSGIGDGHDLHIHIPAGAVPKDGPSAGVALLTAIVSALTGKPIRPDVAMTGEMTLTGDVLAVGGIREKVLGARRAGIDTVLVPAENQPDLRDIPQSLRESVRIELINTVDDVLRLTVAPQPSNGAQS